MERPILRISPKKYAGETTIVSMRMAKDLLKDIDAVANVTGRTRNEILTMSLEFALEHMEIVMREREEKNNGSNQV
jgi:predicted DNA-binding protein